MNKSSQSPKTFSDRVKDLLWNLHGEMTDAICEGMMVFGSDEDPRRR